MKRNTARFLCVVAVCLAATLASSTAEEQDTNQDRQAHRHLQQEDIAAATPAPGLLPDPAAQLPTFMAAAVAAQEFDAAVYPSAAVQQAEETQAYRALVEAAGSSAVRCPTTTTESKIRIAEQEVAIWQAAQIAAAQSAGLSAAAVTAAAFTPVVVYVSWWIYMQEDGKGNVTNAQISQQMAVLNAAYNNTGFSFRVRSVRRITTSPERFKAAYLSPEELQNKQRRLGGGTTLNCYTWDTPNGLLGWSTFPFDYNKTANSQKLDGVVLHYGTLPNGTFARFNLGDTLVHEVRQRVCGSRQGSGEHAWTGSQGGWGVRGWRCGQPMEWNPTPLPAPP
jgi:hypothetical protein